MNKIKYNNICRRFFALIMLVTLIFWVDGCSNSSKKYTISKNSTKNGSFSISHNSAAAGTQITISSVKANPGYKIGTVSVKNSKNKNVATKKSGNSWTFTMPEDNVSVNISFVQNATTTTATTTTTTTTTTTKSTATTSALGNVTQEGDYPYDEAKEPNHLCRLPDDSSNIVGIAKSQIGYYGGKCYSKKQLKKKEQKKRNGLSNFHLKKKEKRGNGTNTHTIHMWLTQKREKNTIIIVRIGVRVL